MLKVKFFLVAILPIILVIMTMKIILDVKAEQLIADQLIRFEKTITAVENSEDVNLVGVIEGYRTEITQEVEKTLSLLNWIVIFSICIVFSSGVIINIHERHKANQKLKALTRRTLEFQEEERARVSRELHDGISQILVSVKYSIELAVEKIKTTSGDPVVPIEKGAQSLHQAISEVRRISRDLRPTVLDDLGLGEALDTLCQEYSDRTGIFVQYHQEIMSFKFSEDVKTTFYRIAQEALTNIERHSGAKSAKIEIKETSTEHILIIQDDGCGFSIPKFRSFQPPQSGLGLKNMMERVAYHDGEITFNSDRETGTRIVIKLPLILEKAA